LTKRRQKKPTVLPDLNAETARSKRSTAHQRARRRHVVNWRLFLITIAAILVALPTSYLWYRHRAALAARTLLDRAESLEADQNWSDATTYYQRYLLLRPDDTDAMVKLIDVYAQSEPASNRLPRLNALLYRTLGRIPNRDDLRIKLAENLLQLGAFEEAEEEANTVLEKAPEHARDARRLIALSQIARARLGESVFLTEALGNLIHAAEESPGDVQLIEITANALREHPAAVLFDATDSATRADQLMDQLVDADPRNADARVARYRYRLRHKLPDSRGDLNLALEIDPDHVDALLLSALAIGQAQSKGTATEDDARDPESLLRRAIEAAPDDPRSYLALAGIREQSGNRDGALDILRRGRDTTEDRVEFDLAIANTQINDGLLDGAEQTVEELEAQSATFLARVDATSRTRFENRLHLLRARLEVAQGHYESAMTRLQPVLLTLESSLGKENSLDWIQAARLTASVQARLGRWDKSSEYWGQLAEALPGDVEIVSSAVEAFLRAGDAPRAVAAIENLMRVTQPNADLLVRLVEAHLSVQIERAPEDRNWIEFENALKEAKSHAPDRWELVIAELNFHLARNKLHSAVALLRGSEQSFSDEVLYWRNVALAYQQLGEDEDMRRALAKHHELETSQVARVSLDVALLVNAGEHQRAAQLLADAAISATPAERRRIDRMRVETLVAGGLFEEALALATSKINEADPQDLDMLETGIEVALARGELELAKSWETSLRNATGNGEEARRLMALRMLLSYDELERQEKLDLQREIAAQRAERPQWYPVVVLSARLAQLEGDSRRALSDYQLAVELGDRRTFTLQQLISLLYEHGRVGEAENYLSLISLNERMDPFLGEVAVRHGRKELAIEQARENVNRLPGDVMQHLYLASLLIRFESAEEAAEVLHKATQQFPNDSRVWVALLNAYFRAGQPEQVRSTLAHLVEGDLLSLDRQHFIAAQGYEMLGELQDAKKQYELSLTQQPTSTDVRLKYAQFLARSNPRAAQKQYERILQLEPVNDQAKRELALLLAATGREEDWGRATQLLDSSRIDKGGISMTNDRLRAMLVSQRGRTRSERVENGRLATEILQGLIERDTGDSKALDQLLLGQVLENMATLSDDSSLLLAAQEHFSAALEQGVPSAERLFLYIEFLLRHMGDPNSQAAGGSRVEFGEQGDVFLAEAGSMLETLSQRETTGDDGFEVLRVAMTARLMQARGPDSEAEEYVSEYVTRETRGITDERDRAQRYLAAGHVYSSIGNHQEAEKWYRRLMEHVPGAYALVVQSLLKQERRQAASDLILEVAGGDPSPEMAIMLANLLTERDEEVENATESEVALNLALKSYGDNVELLQAAAVMQASRGQYDAAIAGFRRVLQLDSEKVLALNNLATLLAERPNQLAEALVLVQRAIDIAGRNPVLLDTQGTIFLKTQDAQQAIACLEEATAGGAADARYYLHLAAAYHLAERDADAFEMLNEARAFGLEKFVLTEDDRELLASLDSQLTTAVKSLD